jgi:probable phosphoglycerate mutase
MIYLMRHGQTIWNTQTRLQGRMDSPLTATGVAQAQAFGHRLKTLLPDVESCRAVSSPLGRAWQTAVLAVTAMGGDPVSIEHDDRLMEHAFGEWEGLKWDEVNRDHAASLAARMADKWNVPAPGGESYADVARRTAAWLADVDETATTIVVCHGVTARVLRGVYAGLGQADVMTLSEPQDKIFALADGGIEEIAV